MKRFYYSYLFESIGFGMINKSVCKFGNKELQV